MESRLSNKYVDCGREPQKIEDHSSVWFQADSGPEGLLIVMANYSEVADDLSCFFSASRVRSGDFEEKDKKMWLKYQEAMAEVGLTYVGEL